MKDTLVIRLLQCDLDQDSLVEWVLFDEQQQKIDGTTTSLSELSGVADEQSDDYQVLVMVAVEDVLLTKISIPSTQMKQVKQALPFMVEEHLACEIENVHLVLPSPLDLSRGSIDVGVVQHSVLIHWLDLLHSNDLSPTGIAVDALCVPRDENAWSLIVDKNRLIFRTAETAGFASELGELEMMIRSVVKQFENSGESIRPKINLIETRGGEVDQKLIPNIVNFIHNNYPDFEVTQTQYQEDCKELFAGVYLQDYSRTLNLLQGGYRINAGSQNNWQRWSVAASVAGVGLVAYLLITLASGFYFTQQAETLDRDAVALYKRLFPNERRVVSPKKQMQNHLNNISGGAGGGGFLPLIAQTATQFGSTKEKGKLAVQQLRFDSDRNDLQLEIQSQTIEQLDQFKQLLADSGLSVDINSATEQDNFVVGRLIVREM
jgi:general secretion pathway protein L